MGAVLGVLLAKVVDAALLFAGVCGGALDEPLHLDLHTQQSGVQWSTTVFLLYGVRLVIGKVPCLDDGL